MVALEQPRILLWEQLFQPAVQPGFQLTAAGWRLHAARIPVGYGQDRPQFDWP